MVVLIASTWLEAHPIAFLLAALAAWLLAVVLRATFEVFAAGEPTESLPIGPSASGSGARAAVSAFDLPTPPR